MRRSYFWEVTAGTGTDIKNPNPIVNNVTFSLRPRPLLRKIRKYIYKNKQNKQKGAAPAIMSYT